MICIQCGGQNDDSISYCRQCGTNLQAVRSALLGIPPSQSHALAPTSSKLAPVVFILSALFGFLGFGALFGAIIAIIAIGADPSSRIDPAGVIFLATMVAITGTLGIVFVIRNLLKMVATMNFAGAPAPQRASGPIAPIAMSAPSAAAALPPPRQPMSVVEHTTANLPNYVRPSRDTGE